MTTKRKNARSLDAIADHINALERTSIFEVGDLLIEAKAQCEHGEWLSWLDAEFDWSVDKAELFMQVARLGNRFQKFRNLKLAKTTLYELAGSDYDDDVLGAIVAELAKHATGTKLRACDAGRVIKIGIGRRRFGDHPDATLVQLVELDEYSDESWQKEAVAALQQRQPETDESATAIVDAIELADRQARNAEHQREIEEHIAKISEAEREAEQEAEAILDGPPPELPPSIVPPEPQKLEAPSITRAPLWAGEVEFHSAVANLLELSTKPAARFIGRFSTDKLRAASDFLMAVAEAEAQQHDEKAKAEAAG
jgi:hypothetical protein